MSESKFGNNGQHRRPLSDVGKVRGEQITTVIQLCGLHHGETTNRIFISVTVCHQPIKTQHEMRQNPAKIKQRLQKQMTINSMMFESYLHDSAMVFIAQEDMPQI